MKTLSISIFFCLLGFFTKAQNVILGTNGFLANNPFAEDRGFGIYTRMGVEVINVEIGIKSFYGNLEQIQSYGVSLYSFIPMHRYKKWQVLGHVEGGLSFVFNDFFGSQVATQMGLGPSLRYNLRDYFSFEFTLEYVIFATANGFSSEITQLVIPTIGWSVRI